jgi:exodeoxyribonuclease VII small subunit
LQAVSRKRSSPPDFEQALAELETLVEKMEQGDLSLEESLQSFERGIQLTRNCQQALQAAEQKVQILLEKDGGAQLEDFASSDD